MFGIGAINFKNSFENIIFLIIGVSIGASVTYLAVSKTNKDTSETILQALTPVIKQALSEEKMTNVVQNVIKPEFDKIKNADGFTVVLDQKPNTDQKPTQNIEGDSIICDCYIKSDQVSKLSNRTKRLIKRDLE